jgi:hypothetical protein
MFGDVHGMSPDILSLSGKLYALVETRQVPIDPRHPSPFEVTLASLSSYIRIAPGLQDLLIRYAK